MGGGESAVTEATRAVDTLRAYGAADPKGSVAVTFLLHALFGAPAAAAKVSARAAVAAGAYPVLAAAVRQTSCGAAPDDKTCATACAVLGSLTLHADAQPRDASELQTIHDTIAALADALAARGSEDVDVATDACMTLSRLVPLCALPGDERLAPRLARGLAQALASHSKSADTCEAGLAVLNWLFFLADERHECVAATFLSSHGLAALLSAADQHCGESERITQLLVWNLRWLTRIHSDQAAADARARAMLSTGSVSVAVRALRLYGSSNIKVADAAREFLEAVLCANVDDAAAEISAVNGWCEIVTALRVHGVDDVDFAVQLCKLISFSARQCESRRSLAAAGVISVVIAIMSAHGDSAMIQLHGTIALANFADAGLETADMLDAACAPAAVVAAAERHPGNARIQGEACRAIGSLCLAIAVDSGIAIGEPQIAEQTRVANAAVNARAPAAVLAALRSHPDDKFVLVYASRALGGLLTADAWQDKATLCEVFDTLMAHIAEHGLYAFDKAIDLSALMFAVHALLKMGSMTAIVAVPPRAASALFMILRIANERDPTKEPESRTLAEIAVNACVACMQLACLPGAFGISFRADACAAGLVELLAGLAASSATPGGGRPYQSTHGWLSECTSYLWCLAALAEGSRDAACRAAACGVHGLIDACLRAFAIAGTQPVPLFHALTGLEDQLHKLESAHEDGTDQCAAGQGALRLMSRRRCCELSCTAVEAPLKRCARCKCARFCSDAHQRLGWARHKAVCKARADVNAACARLLAHAHAAQPGGAQ